MSSRTLLNLGMLTAVILLVLLVVYEPGKAPAPATPTLTTLKPDEVRQLRLERSTGETVELYREQGVWRMRTPYALAANDFRVAALLRIVQAESHARHALDGLALQNYGLDQPRASLVLNDTLRIEFGGTEPLSQRRYVRAGDELHLINDTFYYQAASPATAYASHALLPHGQITALHLPGLQLTFEQEQWRAQPEPPDYSTDQVSELLGYWRHTQAMQLQPFTGELPTVDIRVDLRLPEQTQAQQLQFSLLRQQDEPALLRHDLRLAYVLSEDNLQRLLRLPDPLPDPLPESLPESLPKTLPATPLDAGGY